MIWIALTAAFGPLIVPASTLAEPGRDDSLRAFLQQRFHDERDSTPSANYVAAWADLNGDRRPEAIVAMSSGMLCGTGGCPLFVITQAGHSWRVVSETSITNAPIRALTTRSHGWLDLGVVVRGGGARQHNVRLSFNGRTYPGNPSLAPALPGRPTGRVLITDDDPTRPLF